jgi:DNA-binding transcriptional LysR family regulator
MDKLRALEYFVRVSETSSFSQAAEMLDVPASSVSRRIQDLENLLGISLFHRSTRVVKLTELGTLYLEQIRPAMAALTLADEVVGQHAETPSGVLKITVAQDYGQFRLLPALAKLREQYPEIVCDVELTDEIASLTQNDVDIAIRATASLPERSVARKLADGRFVMVASPSYLSQHGVPRTVADLQSHKAMLYRRPQGILYWQAKMVDGWHELRLPPAFISNQGASLLDEAVAGRGVALIPKWGIVTNLADGSLVQIDLEDAEVAASRNENAGIYLLYHRPKYSLKKIRTAVDFLLSELSEPGG